MTKLNDEDEMTKPNDDDEMTKLNEDDETTELNDDGMAKWDKVNEDDALTNGSTWTMLRAAPTGKTL